MLKKNQICLLQRQNRIMMFLLLVMDFIVTPVNYQLLRFWKKQLLELRIFLTTCRFSCLSQCVKSTPLWLCQFFYSFRQFGKHMNLWYHLVLFRLIFWASWGIRTLLLSLEPAQKLGFLSTSIFLMEALKTDSAAKTTLPHSPGKLEYELQQNCVLFSSSFIIALHIAQ